MKATPSGRDKFWIFFAFVTVALLVLATIRWVLDNPIGTSWDESLYFNQVIYDSQRVESAAGATAKIVMLGRAFVGDDRGRPPAFRVFAMPVTYALGFSSAAVRLVSLAFLVATVVLTYLTIRCVAGRSSAAFGAAFLALCPGILFESMTFGTEYPLFFATSAMLYFLFSQWNTGSDSLARSVGLGLSLGLGALAKASFLLIGGPMLLVVFVLAATRRIATPTPRSLIRSGVIGALVALPWWALNFGFAVKLAAYARDFSRHSLGSWSPSMLAGWLELFVQNGLGLPLTVVSLLVPLAWIKVRAGEHDAVRSTYATVVLTCLLSSIPLLIAHLSGGNQNLMHITPILPLVAVGMAVLADSVRWDTIAPLRTAIAAMFVLQLGMTLWPFVGRTIFPADPAFASGRPPWLVMARMEQWDWNELRAFCLTRRISHPTIAFMGNARWLNPPGIAHAWIAANDAPTDVKWLWRYEDGAIDWAKVMTSADDSAIVLTVPGYVGMRTDKQDIDNQHNAEFAARLRERAQFCGPHTLRLGRFEPVDVLVFVNRRAIDGSC